MAASQAQLRAFVERAPGNAQAHHKLGLAQLEGGDLAAALGSMLMALALAPGRRRFRADAVHLLGITGGYRLPERILAILEDCAEDEATDPQALAPVARGILEDSPLLPALEDLLEGESPSIEAALAGGRFDPIWGNRLITAVLSRALIAGEATERLLTRLRHHTLATALAADVPAPYLAGAHPDFLAALAGQCFNSEYAFAVTVEEESLIGRLIRRSCIPGGGPSPLLDFMLLAAYRPLRAVEGIEALTAALQGPRPAGVDRLLRRHLDEPRQEAELARDLPSLTGIDDSSQAVRDQYERFPYPRWSGIRRITPRPIAEILGRRFPHLDRRSLPRGKVDILIAGCGTGRQSLQVATTYRNARITAIDLSRASLAYARRRAAQEGIRNVAFAQADIMKLGDSEALGNRRFDFIECSGVLHHLAEPLAGWRVLCDLLSPSGFMRIALYSRRGRRDAVAARRMIQERGFEDSHAGVRAARQAIIELETGHPAREVLRTPDFYSISGVHDFIFNVREALYTPLELADMLARLGLSFLGFDHPSPAVKQDYARQFPDDPAQTSLANWDRFEQDNPRTFAAMLEFWCRRE